MYWSEWKVKRMFQLFVPRRQNFPFVIRRTTVSNIRASTLLRSMKFRIFTNTDCLSLDLPNPVCKNPNYKNIIQGLTKTIFYILGVTEINSSYPTFTDSSRRELGFTGKKWYHKFHRYSYFNRNVYLHKTSCKPLSLFSYTF